ncbi:hypothetical protein, partial [Novilysobacter selenitireducens]
VLQLADRVNLRRTTAAALASIWPQQKASLSQQRLDPFVLKLSHAALGTENIARIFRRFTRCVEIHLLQMTIQPNLFNLLTIASKTEEKQFPLLDL